MAAYVGGDAISGGRGLLLQLAVLGTPKFRAFKLSRRLRLRRVGSISGTGAEGRSRGHGDGPCARCDPTVLHGLQDNDQRQRGYLEGDDVAEIAFGPGANGAPQPAAGVARSVSKV